MRGLSQRLLSRTPGLRPSVNSKPAASSVASTTARVVASITPIKAAIMATATITNATAHTANIAATAIMVGMGCHTFLTAMVAAADGYIATL